MAQWPDFSERQFELACNLELLGPSTSFFAPSTNLEQALGFDVSLAVGNPAAWASISALVAIAGAPAAPQGPAPAPPPLAGLVLGVPGRPLFSVVSLFVQYKCPFHLKTTASAHGLARAVAFGAALAAPFFRVVVSNQQHSRFAAWETSVAPFGGVARYAAPCFRTWGAMAANQAAGVVHQNSAFVSPGALAASRTWTYNDPAGVPHMRHSEPEPIGGSSLEDVANQLGQAAGEGGIEVIRSHLADLVRVATEEMTVPDPMPAIRRRFPGAGDDALWVAAQVASVRYAAAVRGASWALLIRWRGAARTHKSNEQSRALGPAAVTTSLRGALLRMQNADNS
jgi:hypothetical protein